jgi:hypothetical protein
MRPNPTPRTIWPAKAIAYPLFFVDPAMSAAGKFGHFSGTTSVANDPYPSSAAKFAVMHNTACSQRNGEVLYWA